MSYSKNTLNRMKREELAALAIKECGEFFDEEATKQQMLDVLIPKLVSGDDDAPGLQLDKAGGSNDPAEEYVYLMLASDSIDGRSTGDQFLSVNSYDIQVTFGKWAKVRRKIVTMLDELTMTNHEVVTDDHGKMRTVASETLRFNYQSRTLEQGPGKELKRSGSTSTGSAY